MDVARNVTKETSFKIDSVTALAQIFGADGTGSLKEKGQGAGHCELEIILS